MGLFSKIKNLFSKKIQMQQQNKSRLISVANTNGIIKIDAPLTVPKNYVAIIETKGKICDVFPSGEYELSPGVIQKASKVRKLTKANKKGKFKKKFKGYVYFVNLNEFLNKEFESCQGVFVKEKNLFSTTIKLFGNYSLKVSNPKKILQTMLSQFHVVTGEIAERQVQVWVGEYVDKFIQSKKLSFQYFAKKEIDYADGLFEYIKKKFDSIGIDVLSCEITNHKYPQKIQKKIEQSALFTNNVNAVLDLEKEKKEKLEDINKEIQCDNTLNLDNITPYENNMFDNYETDNIVQTLNNNNEITEKTTKKEEDFVNDNNYQLNSEDEEYGDDEGGVITAEVVKFKKCSKCNSNNPTDSTKCFNCGETFTKKCSVCGNALQPNDYVCSNCGAIII